VSAQPTFFYNIRGLLFVKRAVVNIQFFAFCFISTSQRDLRDLLITNHNCYLPTCPDTPVHFIAYDKKLRFDLFTRYAYALEEKGRLYCITDVEDLHQWHVKHCDAHPAFRKLGSSDEPDSHGGLIEPGGPMEDPAVACMIDETEEGKKVARAGNAKYWVVYERLPNDQVPKALLFPPPSTD
jgi:hypothetical protein